LVLRREAPHTISGVLDYHATTPRRRNESALYDLAQDGITDRTVRQPIVTRNNFGQSAASVRSITAVAFWKDKRTLAPMRRSCSYFALRLR
jgi:hypothetical protein